MVPAGAIITKFDEKQLTSSEDWTGLNESCGTSELGAEQVPLPMPGRTETRRTASPVADARHAQRG
jgi:hypothetical protein